MVFSFLPLMAQFSQTSAIKISLNKISTTKEGADIGTRVFHKGQKLFFELRVSGLMKDRDENFDLEADFIISDMGKKNTHGKGKVLNKKVHAGKNQAFNMHFSIQISDTSKPGRHNIEIDIKDKVSAKFNKINIVFDVK